MKRQVRGVLALALLLVLPVAGWTAAEQAQTRTTLGKVTITSQGPFEGPFRGPWEWTGGVSVTSQGMTLKCTSLKVWPAKTGRDFERMEATGNVRITGVFTAADKTKWEVDGRAQTASFNSTAGTGVLTGEVSLRAVDLMDKSAFSAKGDTFTYNQKTQRFRIERSGKQVEVEIEPAPVPAGKTTPAVAKPASTGKVVPAAKPAPAEKTAPEAEKPAAGGGTAP